MKFDDSLYYSISMVAHLLSLYRASNQVPLHPHDIILGETKLGG